jgi:tetratricopeptide (TPR) repeat protein
MSEKRDPYKMIIPLAVGWLFVAMFGVLAHGTSLQRAFVLDARLLLDSILLDGPWRILQPDILQEFQPGRTFLYSLYFSLFATDPWGWQMGGLVALFLGVMALYTLIHRIYGWRSALLASLVYAVHPMHVFLSGWMINQHGAWMFVLGVVYLSIMLDDLRDTNEVPDYNRFILLPLVLAAALFFRRDAAFLPIMALIIARFQETPIHRRFMVHLFLHTFFALFVVIIALLLTPVIPATPGTHEGFRVYSDWVLLASLPRFIVGYLLQFFMPFFWDYGRAFNWSPYSFFPLAVLAWSLVIYWLYLQFLSSQKNQSPATSLGHWIAIPSLAFWSLPWMININPLRADVLIPGAVGLCLVLGHETARRWKHLTIRRRQTKNKNRRLTSAAVLLFLAWVCLSVTTSLRHHRIMHDDSFLVEKLLAIDPSPRPYLMIGYNLYRSEALIEAESFVSEGLRKHPESLDLRVLDALLVNERGNALEMKEVVEKVLQVEPRHPEAAFAKALYHSAIFYTEKTPEALQLADENFTLAVRARPAVAEKAWAAWGLTWIQAGNPHRGFKIWTEGNRYYPASPAMTRAVSYASRQLERIKLRDTQPTSPPNQPAEMGDSPEQRTLLEEGIVSEATQEEPRE